jgi:hypothetical protein
MADIRALRDIAANHGWIVCDDAADEIERLEKDKAALIADAHAAYMGWRNGGDGMKPREMSADELLREARVLLNRYWLEVPLGHQPRMIAADAESVVSRIDAHLASHQSDYDKGLLRAAEICAIEEAIAAGKMTAPMVFTKMRELIRASPRSRRNRD